MNIAPCLFLQLEIKYFSVVLHCVPGSKQCLMVQGNCSITLRVACWAGFFGCGETDCYTLMAVTGILWLRRYIFIKQNDGGITLHCTITDRQNNWSFND
jgi:hypothetical protein